MAEGRGKYDDLCTLVRCLTGADGVVLMVVNGSDGCGFSAQCTNALALKIPAALRELADLIDADNAAASSVRQ